MSARMEPLRFERLCLEKVWGGTALARYLALDLPPEKRIGETWEIVDREGEQSRVVGGEFAGASLGELMARHRDAILGKAPATKEGRFPLLVKYIDADEALSVQVHPDDASAREIGAGAEGKTEAWYFLESRAGGSIWCGLDPAVTPDRLRAAAGTRALVELVQRQEVRAHTAMLVPGGTIHAIGAGVTLLEVQQNSDTTYRLYDWDRVGQGSGARALHLEDGCRVAHTGRARPELAEARWQAFGAGLRRAPMARSAHFAMDAFELGGPAHLSTAGSFRIVAAIESPVVLESAGRATTLARGDVALVPAALPQFTLAPVDGHARVVVMSHSL